VTYSERLTLPWWWTLLGLLFTVSLSVAVLAYVRPAVGISFTVLLMGAVAMALFAYGRTRLTVNPTGLRVGRYRVEGRYIAGATALVGEAARAALGPDADHRAFLFTRPFIAPVVRVDLADPADPHPYWLVSTRDPERLAAAIEEVRA